MGGNTIRSIIQFVLHTVDPSDEISPVSHGMGVALPPTGHMELRGHGTHPSPSLMEWVPGMHVSQSVLFGPVVPVPTGQGRHDVSFAVKKLFCGHVGIVARVTTSRTVNMGR